MIKHTYLKLTFATNYVHLNACCEVMIANLVHAYVTLFT
jgi:hypothetical protein